MENIKFRNDIGVDFDKILKLYNDVGWTAYTKNPTQLEKALKNSLNIWTAWNKDNMVGLARVVGDGVSIIYIQDILVLKKYQGKGIGSKLLELMLDDYQEVRQIILLTQNSDKTIKFYKKNGLVEVSEYNCVAFMK
ncbi:GNAT family N-acetyltransferase [uncultured Anaerococcus sp.]|uniref:GNAT family N-acetyltransferase n=1 Tax=uncultured Anaerococcus sp. TaxID=293428 RepID=UPI00260D617E|nr:GNAT family N-acetyltransferase [uncultured Anaerococcus sp.]